MRFALDEITQGHARALLGLADADSQSAACRRIIDEHLSVRQTEALVATGVADAIARPGPERPAARFAAPRPPIFSIWSSNSIDTWERPS